MCKWAKRTNTRFVAYVGVGKSASRTQYAKRNYYYLKHVISFCYVSIFSTVVASGKIVIKVEKNFTGVSKMLGIWIALIERKGRQRVVFVFIVLFWQGSSYAISQLPNFVFNCMFQFLWINWFFFFFCDICFFVFVTVPVSVSYLLVLRSDYYY